MTQSTLLTIDNAFATAKISLFGGQVLSYIPQRDGRERLFLSSKALLDGSKSIRGGIPLCWPWFGAYKGPAPAAGMPAHGYARTRRWQVVSLTEHALGTDVLLELEGSSGPGFVGKAELRVLISVGEQLRVELQTRNSGLAPFTLGAALHTYFAIDDIYSTRLTGLSGLYSDKTQNWAMLPTPVPYGFSAETDRIHLQGAPHVEIHSGDNCIGVESAGHDSVVVWNPWETGSQAFADLAPQDYQHFVCVETALTQGFTLSPGATHVLRQSIS